jgi:hypothetical protein
LVANQIKFAKKQIFPETGGTIFTERDYNETFGQEDRPSGRIWSSWRILMTRAPHVDDFVRLTRDIPELSLNRGEIGVVRSTWFAPSVAYEVEFHQIGHDYQTRALLLAEQLAVEEGPLFATDRAAV